MLLKTSRAMIAATALAGTIGLSGCGGIDGVELNGGVFDMLGISSAATAANRREPELKDRTGLVIPPDASRLPPPGEVAEKPADVAAAWPTDPEESRARAGSELRRKHAEFCEKALLKQKVDPNTPMDGPLGNCMPSVLTSITGDPTFTTRPADKPR